MTGIEYPDMLAAWCVDHERHRENGVAEQKESADFSQADYSAKPSVAGSQPCLIGAPAY